MNKTFRTFLTGILVFVMAFFVVVPMQANSSQLDKTPLYIDTIDTIFENDIFCGMRNNMGIAGTYGNEYVSVDGLITFDDLSFFSAEGEIVFSLEVVDTELVQTSNSSFWMTQRTRLVLSPGFSPPPTLVFNGFVRNGWHLGVLSLTSSVLIQIDPELIPQLPGPGYTIWDAFYEGYVYMIGR